MLLECFGMIEDAFECSRVLWNALKCSGESGESEQRAESGESGEYGGFR